MDSRKTLTKCGQNLLSSEKFSLHTEYFRLSFKPHHNYKSETKQRLIPQTIRIDNNRSVLVG